MVFENIEAEIKKIKTELGYQDHIDEYATCGIGCDRISESCKFRTVGWVDHDHLYQSYVFDGVFLCSSCRLYVIDQKDGEDFMEKLNFTTEYEREYIKCEYGERTNDVKRCTPFIFKDRGWYWSRKLHTHRCCFYHDVAALADDNKEDYEKIDSETFHKFLYRVDFSQVYFSNGHCSLLEYPVKKESLTFPTLSKCPNHSNFPDLGKSIIRLDREKIMQKLLRTDIRINNGSGTRCYQNYSPEFGSLYAWVPFDKEAPDHYALVYCDQSNKELFGQVATVSVLHNKENDVETFIDMAYIDVDEYFWRKYKLDYFIYENLDNFFPRCLIEIIVQYLGEKNNFIKNHFFKKSVQK